MCKCTILNDLDENTAIYKIISLNYLIKSLKKKRLYLNQIKSWDDPYETFSFLQNFYIKNDDNTLTQVHLDSFIDNLFGQSWTRNEESDAMWRIYSDKKRLDGIKIKTTVGKLASAIEGNEFCPISTYIGPVQYSSIDELEEWTKNANLFTTTDSRIIAEALLQKRNEFNHEDEVRLLKLISNDSSQYEYIEKDNIIDISNQDDGMIEILLDKNKNKSLLYSTQIDPLSLFEEFVLDPRLINNKRKSKRIINQLLKCNVPEKKISISKLYDFKPSINKLI